MRQIKFNITTINTTKYLNGSNHSNNNGSRSSDCELKRTVTFFTHGDWDLKTMLPLQCKLSGVKVPRGMQYGYKNVKTIFSQIYPHVRGKGMANILEAMELELIGRHHSGIDDTRNIARIIIELIKRGAVI